MVGSAMSTKLLPGRAALSFRHVDLVHVVELDADLAAVGDQLLYGAEVVVALPVGIDHVIAEGAPPGLTAVDVGRNGGRRLLAHHQPVVAPELAVEEVAVVVDVVVGGEEHVVDALGRHVSAQFGQARRHLGLGKGAPDFLSVRDGDDLRHVHDGFSPASVRDCCPAAAATPLVIPALRAGIHRAVREMDPGPALRFARDDDRRSWKSVARRIGRALIPVVQRRPGFYREIAGRAVRFFDLSKLTRSGQVRLALKRKCPLIPCWRPCLPRQGCQGREPRRARWAFGPAWTALSRKATAHHGIKG